MKVKEFFEKYLNTDAIICLCEENGNINYTGRLGDAPFWAWQGRDVIKVDGLGTENDLIIMTTGRKKLGTRYIVRYEFRNEFGEWKDDYFSDNGNGWTIRDAESIAQQLIRENIRNVRIEVFTK